jgi:hypothetical protein
MYLGFITLQVVGVHVLAGLVVGCMMGVLVVVAQVLLQALLILVVAVVVGGKALVLAQAVPVS